MNLQVCVVERDGIIVVFLRRSKFRLILSISHLLAGLSGGQRKLLLFELIYQRTMNKRDLLLVFDEPFSGVTDDFLPFIVERLNLMRKQHNILLVTNDHVDALKRLADNTIVVSAIDRSTVQVNNLQNIPREKAILALSVGDNFVYRSSMSDLKFFWDVEVLNPAIMSIVIFVVFAYGLFLVSFWDSSPDQGSLIIVAASLIAIFCVNSYYLALTEWRNCMVEEAEALMHSSKFTNTSLKASFGMILILVVSLIEWGVVVAVVDGFSAVKFWVGIFMDSFSMTVPFFYLGLYTNLPFQAVDIIGSLPFMFMMFFSTTFSPGSGIEGVNDLRYLFSRFYLFCMIPDTKDQMEGCPSEDVNVLYMVLSGLIGFVFFAFCEVIKCFTQSARKSKALREKDLLKDEEFVNLQVSLYGSEVMLKDSLAGTDHSLRRNEGKAKVPKSAVSKPAVANESVDKGKAPMESEELTI